MKIDADDVWLWYHHLENVKALGLSKGEYCARYGLSKVKYGNFRYILNYCKDTSPDRYKVMMDAAMEWEKVKDTGIMTMKEFCKPRRIKRDDLYVAMKHQEVKYIILKRIAENVPPPELVEVKVEEPKAAEVEKQEEVESLSELVDELLAPNESPVFETFEHLATDEPEKVTPMVIDEPAPIEDPIDPKGVINKWRQMRKVPTLADYISKAKLAEDPPAEVHFDEADELERLAKEIEEEFEEPPQLPEPPKRGRKAKTVEEEFVMPADDTPKMKFFTLQTPPPLEKPIEENNWSEEAPMLTPAIEPAIQLKGNRIELTFTKTVRLTAAPDTPHDKLLDIINLLKDL